MSSNPVSLWLLKAMLLILGISALFPGFNLILDPSGKGVGFPAGALDGSPFTNYLIPGILLTLCNGLLPLVAWYALWKRPKYAFWARLNPVKTLRWSWTLALISGVGLVIWIVVQMTMVPFFFLQPLLLGWGLSIIGLCLMPGVRAVTRINL